MDLNKPHNLLTPAEQHQLSINLAGARRYKKPRRMWVEDGHVFVEDYDGEILSMTPEVAIEMGRMLADFGTESLINRIMDDKTSDAPQSETL